MNDQNLEATHQISPEQTDRETTELVERPGRTGTGHVFIPRTA